MNDFIAYTDSKLKNKIGYLLSKIDNQCTLLDLNYCLYFLDEESVKRTGVPFTWQRFQIWEMGPICHNLYLEFKEGIRFKKRGETLGLFGFISLTGTKWNNVVTIIDSYDETELSDFEKELVDELSEMFNDSIANDNWLYKLVDTVYHQYTKKDYIEEQWSCMNGTSYTTINWLEYIDLPGNKIEFKDRFNGLY